MKEEVEATLKDTSGRRERFLANIARHRLENATNFPSDRRLSERAKDLATDIELNAQGLGTWLDRT